MSDECRAAYKALQLIKALHDNPESNVPGYLVKLDPKTYEQVQNALGISAGRTVKEDMRQRQNMMRVEQAVRQVDARFQKVTDFTDVREKYEMEAANMLYENGITAQQFLQYSSLGEFSKSRMLHLYNRILEEHSQ